VSDINAHTCDIVFGDIDGDRVINRTDTLGGDVTRKLFYLSNFPAYIFQSAIADGSPLPLSDYCYDIVIGWFSLKNAPANGSKILLDYSYSMDLELEVGSPPLKQYRNTTKGIEEFSPMPVAASLFRVTSTIIRKGAEISFNLNKRGKVNLLLYNLLGEKLNKKTWANSTHSTLRKIILRRIFLVPEYGWKQVNRKSSYLLITLKEV
jgi:hypothetical protein